MRNGVSDSKNSIQSIERAAAILGMFTTSNPRLSLSELSAGLNLSRATGYRYVSALRQTGLVRYDELTGSYTLGTRLLEMASTARAGLPVIPIAEPIMARLVNETGETAVLSIWDGESPVVVRSNDSSDRYITVKVREGYRLGPTSAQSKIFMAAGMALRTADGEVQSMDPVTARRILSSPAVIRTNVELGIRTIAAPVYLGSQLAAVMGLVGTTSTVPDEMHSALVRRLVAAAREVSDGLPHPYQSDAADPAR
jgi:DNA-binding IclR family transcriptional regulator